MRTPDPDVTWTPAPPRPGAMRVVVTGGGTPTTVDTDELGVLAARLDRAADLFRSALDEAGTAQVGPARLLLGTVAAQAGPEAAARVTAHLDHVAGTVAAARTGRDGLDDLADAAGTLATELRLQQVWYAEAERTASTAFDPPAWRVLLAVLPPALLPTRVRLAILAADYGSVGLQAGSAAVTLSAHRLPDAVAAQRHVAAMAEQLQWMNPEVLSGYVHVGPQITDATDSTATGMLVGVADMTPVQRAALGMLPLLSQASLVPHGFRELGLVSASLRTPPGVAAGDPGRAAARRADPTALRTPGALTGPVTLPTRLGEPVRRPPRTPAQALARIPALEEEIRRRGTGAVEILRTTTAGGARRWTVVVPGTQDPWAHGRNPMDNETNALTMAGIRSDMEIAVASAMGQAGIAPGEPVAIVGHSQGGLVAARLAADELLAGRFSIDAVLTAGSPVSAVEVPARTAVLSLEDMHDPVVGLDGAPNPARENHVTVAVDGGEPAAFGDAHRLPRYVGAADLLGGLGDPAVQEWLATYRETVGAGQGERTDSLVFELQRY